MADDPVLRRLWALDLDLAAHPAGLQAVWLTLAASALNGGHASTRTLVEWLASKPRPATAVAAALATVVVLLQIGDNETYDFIYFQF